MEGEFCKFCAEGVKPEGNDYYADHFWLKNQRKNTERGLRNNAAFEKDIVQRLIGGTIEKNWDRMNIYHFKEH